jgi:hypothetical protein
VEAKAARRDDKRAREASPDVVRLPGGGDPMGGGDGDSFQAAQARCLCQVDKLYFGRPPLYLSRHDCEIAGITRNVLVCCCPTRPAASA